ncbi:hypothetical protein TSUD_206510 [Trifolium subterraneum]|uniref:Uncharacterized protein n=1 Tax=Trifolium subterraneum TaxID=3900 RepID=A0A2Z6N8Q1_TRISU|nr:hypothetical protein TSUD_206510 [Trifolium subterraneum]
MRGYQLKWQYRFYTLNKSGFETPMTEGGSGAGNGVVSSRDNYASVRRENRELKLEITKMRMRLTH